MWIRLLTITAALCATIAAQNPAGAITAIGTFTSASGEDRTDSYTVQLWRQGETVFGFLSVASLSGDGPIGTLQNVKFEERSGKLIFEAKLSTGMRLLANNAQQASRDLFRFRGTFAKDALSGTMAHSDLLDPAVGETSARVRLQKQAGTAMLEAKTYADWKAAADEILKARGPKW
jgi:hypothetical protein